MRLILLGCACLLGLSLQAQNRATYFKVFPVAEAGLPDWARAMYAADPQVPAVDQAFDAYYRTHPFQKTIHTHNYRYWRRMVEPWLDEQGYIRRPDAAAEASRYRQLQPQGGGRLDPPLWRSMGPFETYEQGGTRPISWQVNVYCVDQSLSQPDILYAGTEGGGLYKTTDKGLSWTLVTAGLPVGSVGAVQIHPLLAEQVLMAANRRIYRSTDGGQSWTEVFFFDGEGYELKYHPGQPDTVYLAGEKGLFRSVNGGLNWTQVYSQACWDLDFHPTDPAIVYSLRSNTALKKAEFLRSTDHGFSWQLQTSGWYNPQSPADAIDHGGKIAVTPAMPGRVYVALIGNSKANDDGWIGVYRSDDTGQQWTLPAGQIGGPYNNPNQHPWNVAAYSDGYHQGYYNFDLEASPTQPNKIWVGSIRLSESSNGGQTFQAIGAANSTRLERIHADIQAIEINGDEIWVASDGGLDYSTDGLQTHESRKYGITGSDFWGFGSGWNEDVLVGGKYHNGNGAWYQTYGHGNYLHLGGVEEPTGYVNPLDNRTVYSNRWWAGNMQAQRIPTELTGPIAELPALSMIPNESYIESSSSGMYFDHRYADHIYLGAEGKLWKSVDGGSTYTVLYDFGQGKVMEFVQSRANPNVMYCVFQPGGGYWDACRIFRSTNGGQSWSGTFDIPGNRWRLNITLNPENENELWVASSSGADGAKVFRTPNGGTSWQNMTTPDINGQRPKDIYFQEGTDGWVFLATNNGIFYRAPNSAAWQPYSDGLPFNLSALQLRPFHRDGKLRLATYGRGFWEAPLPAASRPLAQPLTLTDRIYCARDTVPFDCYSVLRHEGAQWQWSFSPQPLYVSDLQARNPRVVFGQEGSYTVTLTVTDAQGLSSSRTVDNMITVEDYCAADRFPGQAVAAANDGDYVQLPDFGLLTNQLTVTAWIKPAGIQNEYSSLFMNQGAPAGFNFRESNNTLAYHWPGGAWWWDSNLEVPADEWSQVAMVVNPTGITLYVNGQSARHTFTVQPVQFTSVLLGSYQNWGGRYFKGMMDEVTVWNRPLSREEIRELRHLTRDQLLESDSSLLAYYQFNEPGGRVNDKKGGRHGRLSGGASRQPSSAPVGGGSSRRLTISQAGSYALEEVGLTLAFDNAGDTPQGELVVSRLDLTPFAPPAAAFAADTAYWIVNNYGSNELPVPATLHFRTGLDPATAGAATLFQRIEDNDDQPDWLSWCEAATAAGGYVLFPDACEAEGSGQFFIGFDEAPTAVTAAAPPAAARVYPNPYLHGQQLTVKLPAGEQARLQLYNADGKLVVDRFLGSEDSSFALPALPAGLYAYRLVAAEWMKVGQLVVGR